MPDGRGSAVHGVMPPHYLHELPAEDEKRFEKIFQKLDLDGNGRIDVKDLSKALRNVGVDKYYAEQFLASSDSTKSGDITLAEFIHYVREHEKNLRLQFSHLDKNKDGKIDLEELIKAFEELGIKMDYNEAKKLLQRMDKDGSLTISFNEWRDFLLYAPSTDLLGLIEYWHHTNYMDIGEDIGVPEDFTTGEMVSGMWWRHLVSGGVAGGVSRTCTAPLDRIKVYLQVHGTRHCKIRSCFRYMLREGGSISLWRGNGINVLKIGPESALKFMAYEQIKRTIKGDDVRELGLYERLMAGSLAGGISQSAIYPLEVLKTRFALRKTGEYSGLVDATKKIYRQGGLKSFYRGYIPNLMGIIPYAGIDLAVYETLKNRYLQTHDKNEQPPFWILLLCGTASSTAGQVCSYPLALVRTRLQADMSPGKPNTMVAVFKEIIKNEGIRGLYRGLTPNFLKVAPAVSISYMVYETVRDFLGVNMT
ncbi:calcium-binding mitochondrial carrier protein SCaMC-2 isoform X1 [Bombus vosnesenskii]|uniref:Calcium-binding mitochondrial carrier protein SCaMC-2 isoform X1 n=4 Tax=Pyrobombus TaxID=144703 RepID=A0A6J3KD49_9HYME|nr:calcium-binding mitochondrial carrier protein SCaMC-2 isoform X1 [Bombus vancouverensis nearcticus]XP_033306657.1 calcium-binding mitochondrial carrier protein SCaMC-2 isoform X1 [Bombus bifarius]XP_033350356.1 calcium-binding mitochondrial carrier protein SCaMC-2 isoform X1 [Bombus vosnesenskii]XP_050472439.1 calcium-binding mitochondrial carrier protein SCaMC-2 isoform X1 [Bombus huntii]